MAVGRDFLDLQKLKLAAVAATVFGVCALMSACGGGGGAEAPAPTAPTAPTAPDGSVWKTANDLLRAGLTRPRIEYQGSSNLGWLAYEAKVAISADLSDKPQSLTPSFAALSPKYSVPRSAGLPSGALAVVLTPSGLVTAPLLRDYGLSAFDDLPLQARAEGGQVVMEWLDKPGGAVVRSRIVASMARTALTGPIANAPQSVRTNGLGVNPWMEPPPYGVQMDTVIDPAARFSDGSAYVTIGLKMRAAELEMVDCRGWNYGVINRVAVPCGNAASLQAAFPLTVDFYIAEGDSYPTQTLAFSQGALETIQGKSVWVYRRSTGASASVEYGAYWEDGTVYLGRVARAGDVVDAPLVLLNRNAADSLKAGLR